MKAVAHWQRQRGPAPNGRRERVTRKHLDALCALAKPTYKFAALTWAKALWPKSNALLNAELLQKANRPRKDCREPLSALFGLERPSHCFKVEPHRWAWFHEPQITAGFEHFLSIGSQHQQNARAIAVVKAAFRCANQSTNAIDQLDVIDTLAFAELCVDKGNSKRRIDLLVELHCSDNRNVGAVVEAKFESNLNDVQLGAYQQHAISRPGWTGERTAFVVIAPFPGKLDQQILFENPDWRASSWCQFMQYLEQELMQDDACEDFRRFRRTIWHRVYQ